MYLQQLDVDGLQRLGRCRRRRPQRDYKDLARRGQGGPLLAQRRHDAP